MDFLSFDNSVLFPTTDPVSIEDGRPTYLETKSNVETSDAMATCVAQPCVPVINQYAMAATSLQRQSLAVTAPMQTAQGHNQNIYTPGEFPMHADIPNSQPLQAHVSQFHSAGHQQGLATPLNNHAQNTMSNGFECKWEGCRHSGRFSREGDLVRHIKKLHISPGAHRCPMPACGALFNRKDNLKDHWKRRHGRVSGTQMIGCPW